MPDVELPLPEAPCKCIMLHFYASTSGAAEAAPTLGMPRCPGSVPSTRGGFTDAARKVLQRATLRIRQVIARRRARLQASVGSGFAYVRHANICDAPAGQGFMTLCHEQTLLGGS